MEERRRRVDGRRGLDDLRKIKSLQDETFNRICLGLITLDHWEKFNDLKKEEMDIIFSAREAPQTIKDNCFELARSFNLSIPENYRHATQLDLFAKENQSSIVFNKEIADKHFNKTSHRFLPLENYHIKIFRVISFMSSVECLLFLRRQESLFIGAQGISIIWKLRENELPRDKKIISFDIQNALWRDSEYGSRVPSFVFCESSGRWNFDLGIFEGGWGFGQYFVGCFKKVN